MSYHTQQYLNAGNIIVGNVENNGYAWWHDPSLENPLLPTHYKGFIPLDIIKKGLFGWSALESKKLVATFEVPVVDEDGNPVWDLTGEHVLTQMVEVPVKSFKALGREDWVRDGVPADEEAGADAILSVQGDGYGVHQLQRLFLEDTAQIVGGTDKIGVESAGLLKWGRRGWITISIPKNIHNDASGMEFRPCLTVSTSFDGSLPSSWTRTFGIPVCDNTLDYQLVRAGDTGKFVLKHTKNSVAKIESVTQAIGLLDQQGEEMDKAFTELSKIDVSEGAFAKWLDKVIPVPDVKVAEVTVKSIQGEDMTIQKVSTNSQTIALNKRDKIMQMWDSDPRVTPFKGTKLGILQLWNTFQTHEGTVKGAKALDGNKVQARVEANMMKTLSGDFGKIDKIALDAIDEVIGDELILAGAAPKSAPAKAARTKAAN